MGKLNTMNWTSNLVASSLFVAGISLLLIPSALSIAVMSVDLGSEFIKIAIVKPGIPMEIVLNKDSRRKTAYAVSFKDGERQFGDASLGVSIKQPPNAFLFTHHLLGKKIDHEMVQLYQSRYPFHKLIEDPDRGTVLFETKETKYSPEELLAMVLNYTRHAAESFADHAMKDIVITVPAYFNQAERRAVVSAAKMVGLNVLQLMNDNTAVALNYGIFRSASFNATEKNYMFVDIGSSSTTATVVGYSTGKVKDRGYLETVPQLVVKGVGFDTTLGGAEIDFRLRDHLVKLFKQSTKTKGEITENPRAMAKLLKEAKRVKQVLSANTDHRAQIEGVFEDHDFRAKVTRQELEDMCADLFERLPKPVEEALKAASIDMDKIESVILMGGGTRMPKFQEILLNIIKKTELGKNINTDEAAALGSVYKAADLSAGFKVKRFIVKDANLFPIDVSFQRHTKHDDGTVSTKTITRTLFQKLNTFPQKKIMTFNKMHDDFAFNVTYGDLSSFGKDLPKHLDLGQLGRVDLKEVAEVHGKNEKMKSKGIKVYFSMDEGGILHVDKAEAHFEKSGEEVEEPTTFQKLGNTLSSLFGGGNEEPKETVQEDTEKKPEEEAEKKEENPEQPKTDEGEKKDTKEVPKEEAMENKEKAESDKKDKPESTDDKAANATKPDGAKTETNGTDTNKTEPAKPKGPVIVKEVLGVEQKYVDTPDLSVSGFEASVTLLSALQRKDEIKLETERARNQLESFVFDMRDKLEDEVIMKLTTEEEREKISGALSKASDWLDDEGYDATADAYHGKLKELKTGVEDLHFRLSEYNDRPIAIQQLLSSLNLSNVFLHQIKSMPDADEIYKEKDLDDLRKARDEAKDWLKEYWSRQNKTSLTEKPVMLVKDISAKLGKVDRELLYLINKAKYYVPKKKPKTNTTEAKSKKTNANATSDVKLNTTESTNTTKASGKNTTANDTANDNDSTSAPVPEAPTDTLTTKADESQKEAPAQEIPALEAPADGVKDDLKQDTTPSDSEKADADSSKSNEDSSDAKDTTQETPVTNESESDAAPEVKVESSDNQSTSSDKSSADKATPSDTDTPPHGDEL